MWRSVINKPVPVFITALLFSFIRVSGQNQSGSEKDVTRPEIQRLLDRPATILSMSGNRNNGFNEVQWNCGDLQDTRKFVLEYSSNGTYYQSAGEVLITNASSYALKHQTFEVAPLLYRLRIEIKDGRSYYSRAVLLDGADISTVAIYPTIITGNTVNARTYFPVERVSVFSAAGQQVFAKDLNGRSGDLAIVVPSLASGIYWMNFYGEGWKTTGKFVVQ